MNHPFDGRSSTSRFPMSRLHPLPTRTWQTTVLLASGLTALTCSSLPAFAAPQETPVAAQTRSETIHNWRDAPVDEHIAVEKVSFDAGGYQVVTSSGATIVVPFANNSTNVMRFARSETANTYFVKEGITPVLYLSNDLTNKGYLVNAAVPTARWYPLTETYASSPPVYVNPATNWQTYSNMGWYPNMVVYGGQASTSRFAMTVLMPGSHTIIGSSSFPTYGSYFAYTLSHPNYVQTRVVYSNYATPPTGTWITREVKTSQVTDTTRSVTSGVVTSGVITPGVLSPVVPTPGIPFPGVPRGGRPVSGMPRGGLPGTGQTRNVLMGRNVIGPGLPHPGQPRHGIPSPRVPGRGVLGPGFPSAGTFNGGGMPGNNIFNGGRTFNGGGMPGAGTFNGGRVFNGGGTFNGGRGMSGGGTFNGRSAGGGAPRRSVPTGRRR